MTETEFGKEIGENTNAICVFSENYNPKTKERRTYSLHYKDFMGYNVIVEKDIEEVIDFQETFDYLKGNYKFLFAKRKPMVIVAQKGISKSYKVNPITVGKLK